MQAEEPMWGRPAPTVRGLVAFRRPGGASRARVVQRIYAGEAAPCWACVSSKRGRCSAVLLSRKPAVSLRPLDQHLQMLHRCCTAVTRRR